jgi:hypothetical protein
MARGKRREMNDFGDLIYAYTRAQALEDGVLVDVSKIGKEAGFKVPVAVTQAVWGLIEDIPPRAHWESIDGRLWDVVKMGWFAAQRCKETDTLWYKMLMNRNEHGHRVQALILKLHIGGGDNGEPVVTIMLRNED